MSIIAKITSIQTRHQAALLLVASFLILFPFRRFWEIPFALMALLGLLILAVQARSLWQRPEVKIFTLIFAAFWVPMLISLLGAVNPERSLTSTLAFARLYPAGIFIMVTLAVPGASEKLLRICAWVLLAWVADALLQIATGTNILGYTAPGGRINGFFGSLRPELGVYLPAISPLLLVYARRFWPPILQIGLVVALTLVVFMAGSRNGWIMFALVLAGLAAWIIWQEKKPILQWLALAALLAIGSVVGAYSLSQPFADRVDVSLMAFRGDVESLNVASAQRVTIWQTAGRMLADQPINGIGARGFRYAYRDYADPEQDPFIQDPNELGATHPHLLILDIGAETGVIGLAGFAFALAILIRTWRQSRLRLHLLPYALAMLAVFFPLNTSYAIYASDWSAFCFWLTALFCATTMGYIKQTQADMAAGPNHLPEQVR
jgi:O-antigen ligase